MLDNGTIEPASSPHNSRIVLVKKPKGDDWRFCVDLRKVNSNMRPLIYPLPLLGQITDVLGGAKFYTAIDIQSAYNIIRVHEYSRCWLAFSEPSVGSYQYRRVPFGLQNSAAIFLMVLQVVLGDMLFDGVVSYVDDVLLFGATVEDHNAILEKVLDRFEQYGIRVAAKKVELMPERVSFLGYKIGEDGLHPCPSKIAALLAIKEPQNVHDVRSMMGMFNFYRKFIKNFARITCPIFRLTGKVPFEWTTECQEALEAIKEALQEGPLNAFPQWDKPFVLSTDASEGGMGYVLEQRNDI
jgi:hypothetical protein